MASSKLMVNWTIFTINQSKAFFNLSFHSHLMPVVLELMVHKWMHFSCKPKFGQLLFCFHSKLGSHFYIGSCFTIIAYEIHRMNHSLWFIGIVHRLVSRSLKQEIPFLSARLYFMFGLQLIKTQMMIFFSAKNLLTILVYGYRPVLVHILSPSGWRCFQQPP